MRRRGLRRPKRRSWFAWARLGAVAAFILVGGGILFYAPSMTGPISALGSSLRSAWDALAERATRAWPNSTSNAVPPIAPSGTVAATAGAERPPAAPPPARSPGVLEAAPAAPEPTRGGEGPAGKTKPIVMPQGGTIVDIAFRSYGGYNVLAIDLIKEFNPHVADLNRIRAGERLRLPSLDAETLIRQQPEGSYRLVLGSFLSHQAADRLRERVRRAGYEAQVITRR